MALSFTDTDQVARAKQLLAAGEFTDAERPLVEAAVADFEASGAQKALRDPARAQQQGLTEEDLIALQGGQGPNLREGFVEDALVGGGRTADQKFRGTQQAFLKVADRVLPGFLPPNWLTDLERDEQEARRLFALLDEEAGVGNTTIGGEDVGQFLGELGFAAVTGGAAKQVIRMAISGAALAGSDATVQGESQSRNALVGLAAVPTAVAAGKLLKGGLGTVGNILRSTPATINALFALGALAAKKGIPAAFIAGRAVAQAERGTRAKVARDFLRQGAAAAKDSAPSDKAVSAMTELAEQARDRLGFLVGAMRPLHQEEAAYGAARQALETSVTTTRQGQTAFNASQFLKEMAAITDGQMKKLGPLGRKLADFRDFAKVLEKVPRMSQEAAEEALAAFNVDARLARSLVQTASKAKTETARNAAVRQLQVLGRKDPLLPQLGRAAGVATQSETLDLLR